MPKGPGAQARCEEIVDACAALYETMGFADITLRDIGARTSFTRTAIYNYFHTKEEIFLALLQREYEAWIADLRTLREEAPGTAEGFAAALARTLEKRALLLKLQAMNLYDIEGNSREENLTAFKRVYARALRAVEESLRAAFPKLAPEEAQAFLYAFFPFLFGIYPYAAPTEKQRRAMEAAGLVPPALTIYTLARDFAAHFLRACLQPKAK